MIAEIFSRIWEWAVHKPGKIDSPGVDITNCQNGNCGGSQRGRLRINKINIADVFWRVLLFWNNVPHLEDWMSLLVRI